ncbi:MAG: FtsX-like permease family protein [Planctomycetota bacterium]
MVAYQALLTRRYLGTKVMPLLAAVAVALCTAMVIVVWSVMGGFLRSLLAQGPGIIGDVSITYPVSGRLRGIAHYEELIDRLESDPMVAGAAPAVETLGLITLPHGETKAVQVIGVEPASYHGVTGFEERLYWRRLDEPLKKDVERRDRRLELPAGFERDGAALSEADPRTGDRVAAAVPGISVVGTNRRVAEGYFVPRLGMFFPHGEITVTVLPMTANGKPIEPVERVFPVANEFFTGMYEADANWVFVPLETLQRMLKIDRAQRLDPDYRPGQLERDPETGEFMVSTPRVIGVEPARVSNVLVRAAAGVEARELRDRCMEIYRAFASEFPAAPSAQIMEDFELIYTWEQRPGLRQFVAAVKKETALVLVLFALISMTAVFLVFSIFWSMISEKTKDIGILRAVGASRAGVAWLFLRYGLVLGVVGASAGMALGAAVVLNINPIHDGIIAVGRSLDQNWAIWDPAVYYFFEIPSDLDPVHAGIVFGVGVLAAVLGALVPAVRAASMDPVRALRFE